ncbi:hypothetical protein PR048_001533 [Dryococelus australis]|uniref:Uncharacterized protein n=1 Tax=Dryococelus australis TaxID=614101 RepID=A0ABQ9IHM1_9NEOP|nr:hypothetical protein PR048_001533 [Dryococelus australis]
MQMWCIMESDGSFTVEPGELTSAAFNVSATGNVGGIGSTERLSLTTANVKGGSSQLGSAPSHSSLILHLRYLPDTPELMLPWCGATVDRGIAEFLKTLSKTPLSSFSSYKEHHTQECATEVPILRNRLMPRIHEHLTHRRPAISSPHPLRPRTRQAASVKDCRPLGCGSASQSHQNILASSLNISETLAGERRSVTPASPTAVGIHGIPRRGYQEAASVLFQEVGTARWVSDYGAEQLSLRQLQHLRYPEANRVQFPAGSPPDVRMCASCMTMPLLGGFSRGSPVYPAISFLRRFIPQSPSSALKASLLRAATLHAFGGESPLNSSSGGCRRIFAGTLEHQEAMKNSRKITSYCKTETKVLLHELVPVNSFGENYSKTEYYEASHQIPPSALSMVLQHSVDTLYCSVCSPLANFQLFRSPAKVLLPGYSSSASCKQNLTSIEDCTKGAAQRNLYLRYAPTHSLDGPRNKEARLPRDDSASEVDKRASDKGYIVTSIKCAIATKHKALNSRAPLSSCSTYPPSLVQHSLTHSHTSHMECIHTPASPSEVSKGDGEVEATTFGVALDVDFGGCKEKGGLRGKHACAVAKDHVDRGRGRGQ